MSSNTLNRCAVGLVAALFTLTLGIGSAKANLILWDAGHDTWTINGDPISNVTVADTVGNVLQVGDKLFDNFLVSVTSVGDPITPGASGINIIGQINTDGEFGLAFTAAWSVLPTQLLDTALQFHVSVADGYNQLIHDNTLAISGTNTTPNGFVSVDESVYVNKFMGSGGNIQQLPLALKHVEISSTEVVLSDHEVFIDPFTQQETALPSVWIVKDIMLNGGNVPLQTFETNNDTNGSARLSIVVQTFSQVPEPASLVLFGLGGTVVFWRRRRR
jgi:PEP-CTERM motif